MEMIQYLPLCAPFVLIFILVFALLPKLHNLDVRNNDHAIKHGRVVHSIKEELILRGPCLTAFNPNTGREARVVDLGDEGHGIQIVAYDHGQPVEVTSFRDRRKNRKAIKNYLKNQGYIQ